MSSDDTILEENPGESFPLDDTITDPEPEADDPEVDDEPDDDDEDVR